MYHRNTLCENVDLAAVRPISPCGCSENWSTYLCISPHIYVRNPITNILKGSENISDSLMRRIPWNKLVTGEVSSRADRILTARKTLLRALKWLEMLWLRSVVYATLVASLTVNTLSTCQTFLEERHLYFENNSNHKYIKDIVLWMYFCVDDPLSPYSPDSLHPFFTWKMNVKMSNLNERYFSHFNSCLFKEKIGSGLTQQKKTYTYLHVSAVTTRQKVHIYTTLPIKDLTSALQHLIENWSHIDTCVLRALLPHKTELDLAVSSS